ncbi:MAG TPA: UDP-N-acetylmuramate:L-alanyl-gamma-D-glutamyl-meso-diaminopimelate ligase, partial [Castellaniella sp.]|nr:UDP-N-acetylmuramate:L-alanyl-gamma-D-glutamyl-meso-diaminopimelate ligase [Castellaniella sp.]
IFEHAQAPTNFLIGGVAPDLAVSARFDPAVSRFVIEADEYDTAFFDKRSKFVHYRPRTVILNNLEYDHADIFPNLQAIETQFHHLIRTVPSTGCIIRPAHDPALDRVLARGCWTPIELFGDEGDWQAEVQDARTGRTLIRHQGQDIGMLDWSLSGAHNRSNALAALAAARHAGIAPTEGLRALCAFQGVRRRLEHRGTVRGIHVYDDFAHHPSAIATTLDGLRQRIGPSERILAVIEPRSNTMKLGTMAQRLPQALAQADEVFCFGAASGKHALGWDPTQVLAPLGARAWSGCDLVTLIDAIRAKAQPGDHILIMSNGGFGGIHQKLLDRLSA